MKKYFASLSLIFAGIACFTAYTIIGAKVAPDGILIEPFYLIPMGELFIVLGLFSALGIFTWQLLKRGFQKES